MSELENQKNIKKSSSILQLEIGTEMKISLSWSNKDLDESNLWTTSEAENPFLRLWGQQTVGSDQFFDQFSTFCVFIIYHVSTGVG